MYHAAGTRGPATRVARESWSGRAARRSARFREPARARGMLNAPRMKRFVLAVCVLAACAADGDVTSPDEEWGMEGPFEPTPPPGKDDSEYRRGLYVNTDTRRTQVWTARNKWEDTTTVAQGRHGVAVRQRPRLGREVLAVGRVARVDPRARRVLDDRRADDAVGQDLCRRRRSNARSCRCFCGSRSRHGTSCRCFWRRRTRNVAACTSGTTACARSKAATRTHPSSRCAIAITRRRTPAARGRRTRRCAASGSQAARTASR